MDLLKTSIALVSLLGDIFVLWLVIIQEVLISDLFLILFLEAFLVIIFGIFKILSLNPDEIESPGHDFKAKKLSNILFIIAPINITFLANIFVFTIGGMFFLLYVLAIIINMPVTFITNYSFMSNALMTFFIVQIFTLIGFIFTKNRSSGEVVSSTNYYTLPLSMILILAFVIFYFGFTVYFNSKIFVILVLLAKILLDFIQKVFGIKFYKNVGSK